jgi:single-strand DNA-binding protein
MAFSINRATLVGNAGKDAEIRYTGTGVAYASFTMATTENWTDKQGQKQERTEWHNIKAWNWLAEYCGENVRKGKRVLVEGRITNRSYDDKDGVKKYISEIEASTIMTMERSAAAGGGNGPSQGGNSYSRPENPSRGSNGNQQSYGNQQSSGPAPVPDYEPQQSGPVDDLPF